MYNAKTGLGVPVGIIQVKEKWGGLRIYTEYYVREIEEVIIEVGRKSLEICEQLMAVVVVQVLLLIVVVETQEVVQAVLVVQVLHLMEAQVVEVQEVVQDQEALFM